MISYCFYLISIIYRRKIITLIQGFHFQLIRNCCFDKSHKKRVRLKNRAAVFGVKLNSYKPFKGRDFYNFNQVCIGIDACCNHSGFFKPVEKLVVKFVTMSVPLFNQLSFVGIISQLTFFYFAIVSAQTHCAAFVGYVFLVFHQIDYRIWSRIFHFCRIGFV